MVDLYHAREHLHALARLAVSGLGDERRGWLGERLAELDRGDVEALLGAARQLSLADAQTQEIEKALGYFETNRERMRYAHFRALGLFVGSGAVEAGCRAVVAQRLKLSGMRWTVRGALPSSASAARTPAAAGTTSGRGSTVRRPRRDPVTYKSVSHPLSEAKAPAVDRRFAGS